MVRGLPMNGFVNLPQRRRKHDGTDQQCLEKPSQLVVNFHADFIHSENVFLNFQTLGAATAKQ
jgi:hypothetical protein